MDSNTVTLGQFLTLPDEKTAEGSDRWKEMEERLGKEIRAIKWKASMPDMAAKIAKLLDIPVSSAWITSWKKAEEVDKALRDSEKAPKDTIELELGSHTITTTLHPYISVQIGKLPEKRIHFDADLTCKLKGFMLTIREGEIREIGTGQCELQGTLKYDKLVLAEHKMKPIKLPGKIPC